MNKMNLNYTNLSILNNVHIWISSNLRRSHKNDDPLAKASSIRTGPLRFSNFNISGPIACQLRGPPGFPPFLTKQTCFEIVIAQAITDFPSHLLHTFQFFDEVNTAADGLLGFWQLFCVQKESEQNGLGQRNAPLSRHDWLADFQRKEQDPNT